MSKQRFQKPSKPDSEPPIHKESHPAKRISPSVHKSHGSFDAMQNSAFDELIEEPAKGLNQRLKSETIPTSSHVFFDRTPPQCNWVEQTIPGDSAIVADCTKKRKQNDRIRPKSLSLPNWGSVVSLCLLSTPPGSLPTIGRWSVRWPRDFWSVYVQAADT